jgi:hypothetical protein
MNRGFRVLSFFAASALLLPGSRFRLPKRFTRFSKKPGCRNCHKLEGVASPTRLHFPAEDVAKARVEAFGKSLVELVDRQDPDKSLLLMKPTQRIPHTGGERITKGSAEEATLKSWIGYLAKLPAAEVTRRSGTVRKNPLDMGQLPKPCCAGSRRASTTTRCETC